MFGHVRLGQFDTNGEDTDGEDHTCKFQGNAIDRLIGTTAPRPWIENVATIRTYDNPKDKCERCLSNVQLVGKQKSALRIPMVGRLTCLPSLE